MSISTITFTSDFGNLDGYAGIVKGVIASINPKASVIDLTHQVEPFNLISAAWIIYNAYNYFPASTVHLVVVDPGVGSSRRGVVLKLDETYFVGPDNGVFSLILQDPLSKRSQDIEAFGLNGDSPYYSFVSSTFHARDIFAKVVAHISLGKPVGEFGKSIESGSLITDRGLEVERNESGIAGRIAHVDRFGNLITNIPMTFLKQDAICFVNDRSVGTLRRTYQSVSRGTPVAIGGSHGFLEVAVCEGRADRTLNAEVGSSVRVDFVASSDR